MQVVSSARGAPFSVFFVSVTGDRNRLRVVPLRGVVYPIYLPRNELPAW